MLQRRQIKAGARRVWRKNFGRVCAVVLLWMGMYAGLVWLERSVRSAAGAPQIIEERINLSLPSIGILTAFLLIHWLVLTPVTYGMIRWLCGLVRGQRLGAAAIFADYISLRAYLRMLAFHLRAMGTILLYILPFLLPAAALSPYFLDPLLHAFAYSMPQWMAATVAWVDFALWVLMVIAAVYALQKCLLAVCVFTSGPSAESGLPAGKTGPAVRSIIEIEPAVSAAADADGRTIRDPSASPVGWTIPASRDLAAAGGAMTQSRSVPDGRRMAAQAETGGAGRVREAFRAASEMTRGRKIRMTTFLFSFIGWAALSILIFPMVYTLPYLICSEAELSTAAGKEPHKIRTAGPLPAKRKATA